MITLVIVLAGAAFMIIFSVQNAAPVVVSFLTWKFETSLAVIILICACSPAFWSEEQRFLSGGSSDRSKKERSLHGDQWMASNSYDVRHPRRHALRREAPWIFLDNT
jgi:hypothetical protein